MTKFWHDDRALPQLRLSYLHDQLQFCRSSITQYKDRNFVFAFLFEYLSINIVKRTKNYNRNTWISLFQQVV